MSIKFLYLNLIAASLLLSGCLGFGDAPTEGESLAACWANAKNYAEVVECEEKMEKNKEKDHKGSCPIHGQHKK